MSEQFNFGPAKSQMADATTTASGLMSATDKSKLDGIESQANKTVVSDSLSDTSTTNALSAAQGKALNDRIVMDIANGTDLNTLTTPGYYTTAVAVSLTNAPVSGTNRLGLIVQKSGTGYVFQIAMENLQNTYGVFTRRCLNGTWSAWQELGPNINSGYGAGVRHLNFTIASNGGTKTISGFTQNMPYLVMISTDNPSAWKYAAVWFMGSQNRTPFNLGTATGVEVTASSSTALVVKNTNTGYALIGNYIIVGYGTNNLTVS